MGSPLLLLHERADPLKLEREEHHDLSTERIQVLHRVRVDRDVRKDKVN